MKSGLIAAVPLLLVLAACAGDPSDESTEAASDSASATPSEKATPSAVPQSAKPSASTAAEPRWEVTTVADGLDHPWGLIELPNGTALFTERSGGVSLLDEGEVTQVFPRTEDLYAVGEGGLMGIEISPNFRQDRRFFTCYASTAGDVRVGAWRLAANGGSAEQLDPLVTGLTLNPSGRHSGCRLRVGADEMLWIGAGDSAMGTNPQDLGALGGKVLRVDPATGQAAPDNPFIDSDDPDTRLIFSYGHRNVQGLAVQPDSEQMWSSEHGPDIDDEVNRLRSGGNYGWDPAGDGFYDESVPMTDSSIEESIPAVWSSGDPTLAISGISFLGPEWGKDDGMLAVASLKAGTLSLLDPISGRFTTAPVLDGDHGRLRAVEPSEDGSFYVLTDNGDDQILRVSP